jgi:hypothetical protein
MKEQMKGVKQRMGDEKKVAQDWEQWSEALSNAAQPISAENEKEYRAFINRAKDFGVEKTQLDTMKTKMSELRDKLGVAASSESEIPAPVMSPTVIPEKKEEVIKEEAPVITEEPVIVPELKEGEKSE